MLLGGLDIGTTGCKLSLYDEKGAFQYNSYREYASKRGDDAQEIDADAVWAAVQEVILESAAYGKIDAIGVTSFGESFVLLDEEDNVLLPSMLYTDKRGNEECKRFDAAEVESITGAKPHGMYSIPKLMWVKENLPEVYARTKRVLLFEDFIIYKLTGVAQIDYSLACRTMGLDLREKCWSRRIFDFAGIDMEKMSRPVPSGSAAGKIIVPELNCPDTVVVNGCHDQLAALLGAGVSEQYTAVDGTGTVECVTPVLTEIPAGRELYAKGYTVVPHYLDGKYVCYAFSFTGGAALKWYKDTFAAEESYGELDVKAKDGPTGILILPHFAGAATPYMDENSKAAILGVTLATSRYDLYKAVMEGVTYEMLLNIEELEKGGIRIDRLYATGGGAKSRAWLQLKADILNRDIVALDAPEAGAAGTVMLAGIALGAFADLDEARCVLVKEKETYHPNPARHEAYRKHYERYRGVYDAVRPLI